MSYWKGPAVRISSAPDKPPRLLRISALAFQMLRVEAGQALVRMGSLRDNLKEHFLLRAGDVVLVPCGTWHNVINTGNCPLKLSSLYAPPQHPRGAVHPTKKDDP